MNQGATWPSMEMPLSSYRAISLLSFQAPASAALARASAAQGNSLLIQQRAQCDLAIKTLVALTGTGEPELRQRLASPRTPVALFGGGPSPKLTIPIDERMIEVAKLGADGKPKGNPGAAGIGVVLSDEAGQVLIIRGEGPVGGPGMREMLGVTAALMGAGLGGNASGNVALGALDWGLGTTAPIGGGMGDHRIVGLGGS